MTRALCPVPCASHSFLVSAVCWLLACSATPEAKGPSPGGATDTVQSCVGGTTRTCHCPDGSEQVQACQPSGELTPCPCPSGTGDGNGGAGIRPPSTDGALCPELRSVGACSEPAAFEAEELPAYLMFVLDRSGSMLCNPPPLQSNAVCEEVAAPADPNLPSKWDLATGAMREVIEGLAGQGLYAGLTMFSTDSACGVDSTPLVAVADLDRPHAATMNAAFNAFPARGLTPIVGSTILAYRHLHNELDVPGNRYVILITDGEESCDVERIGELLDVEMPKSRQALIRTFVIGVPGSEPGRGLLSEMAYRGGTARSPSCFHAADGRGDQGDCHYDMTDNPAGFADELRGVLEQIGSQAMGCEFAVPQDGLEAPTADNVNVQYFAQGHEAPICLAPDFSRACDDPNHGGWRFATQSDGSPDLSRVVVCGSACDTLRRDGQAKVEVIVGCPALEGPS